MASTRAILCAAGLAASMGLACAGGTTGNRDLPGGDADALDAPEVPACPAGQVPGPSGDCMAVGIQGCVAAFLGDDGLCRPTAASCPDGTLPKFDEGCVPVGIQGCAQVFVAADGLCKPSMSACAGQPGTIPDFATGCVPVGIQGCAEVFMGEDGLCRPSMDRCSDAPGTIPKFDTGCVHVGIRECAPVFVGADGLCHPTMNACGTDEFAIPSLGCVPVDGPLGCGEDPFGGVEEASGTVFVDASAPDDSGSGTRANPVKSIARGLALAPSGGRVVLAAGTYAEPVVIQKTLELLGRCPSMVTIAGTAVAPYLDRPTVVLVDKARDVVIRGVKISGDGVGILAEASPGLKVQRTRVSGNAAVGILVEQAGAAASIEDTLVEATRPKLADGTAGQGLQVSDGGSAEVKRSAFVRNHQFGIATFDAGTVTNLQDCLVEGTVPRPSDGNLGVGGWFMTGSSTVIESTAFVGNRELGVLASAADTTVELNECLVEGTLASQATQLKGVGIWVEGRGVVTVQGSALVGNRGVAAFAMANGSSLHVEGTLVAGTLPQDLNSTLGEGLEIAGGATGTFVDNAVVGNRSMGILAQNLGSTLTARGNLVEGTMSQKSDLGWGIGIQVNDGATGTLTGNALVSNRTAGMNLTGIGTTVEADGNFMADTLPREVDQLMGQGAEVSLGASATFKGNAVIGNRNAGLSVVDKNTLLVAQGNLVRGTKVLAADGQGGLGIGVDLGGHATTSGNAVVGTEVTGLNARGAGSVLESTRDLVEGTGSHVEPGETSELDLIDGSGVGVSDKAVATLTGVAIVGNDARGFQIAKSSDVTIQDSLVFDSRPDRTQGKLGIGVVVNGSALTLLRNAILENHVAAVSAIGYYDPAGAALTETPMLASVEATGNLVADTQPQEFDGADGVGAVFLLGATGHLEHNLFVRNRFYGLTAWDEGTAVTGTGNLIQDTSVRTSDGKGGAGVGVGVGGSVTLDTSALVANEFASLVAGGTFNLAASTVDGGPSDRDGKPPASGLMFTEGSTGKLDGLAVLRTGLAGVLAGNDSTKVDITGSLVSGVVGGGDDSTMGTGVAALQGGALTVNGTVIRDCLFAGVLVSESTATVDACDISGTSMGHASKEGDNFMGESADGLLVMSGSTLTLSATRIADCDRIGVHIDKSSGEIRGSTIVGHPYGMVVNQAPSFSMATDLSFDRNGVNLLTDTPEFAAPQLQRLTPDTFRPSTP